MSRPRKSTRDEWLDTFGKWDERERDVALEIAEFIHKRTGPDSPARKATKKEDAEGPRQDSLCGGDILTDADRPFASMMRPGTFKDQAKEDADGPQQQTLD